MRTVYRLAIMEEINGVIVFYTSYWRYLIITSALSLMLFVLGDESWNMIHRLPLGHWRTWNNDSQLALISLFGLLFICYFLINVLRSGYKAVQFEIGVNYIKLRKPSIMGGIINPDKFIVLKFNEINIRTVKLLGYVIKITTKTGEFQVMLLMSANEKIIAYRALEKRIDTWLLIHKTTPKSIYQFPEI